MIPNKFHLLPFKRWLTRYIPQAAEREKLVNACKQCHSRSFAEAEMGKGDDMIREIDHLMAEAIRIVAALYEAGLLQLVMWS